MSLKVISLLAALLNGCAFADDLSWGLDALKFSHH
jgi:hypothetical protein